MIKCEKIAEIFSKNDLTFFSGVPDSTFKDWMKFLADNNGTKLTNRIAVNECEATALAAGYHLSTGNIGVIYMQNSGLGKTVNPLTSLMAKEVYSMPVVLMVGWRGEPELKDEPQHKMMGRVMLSQLETLEIPFQILPDNIEQAQQTIEWAKTKAEKTQYASAIIIKKGIFEKYETQNISKRKYEMTGEQAIHTILGGLEKQAIIVSTTGKTSRELFEYRKEKKQSHEKDFLTVGSMGCSASIANEIALQKPSKPIYVFDGDGAALMQMGALANIGSSKAENLTHLIFDNGSYDSTGGQPTISDNIDFSKIALGCGYRFASQVETSQELIQTMSILKNEKGPKMVVVKVKKGSRQELGRPTNTPLENKRFFMEFLNK